MVRYSVFPQDVEKIEIIINDIKNKIQSLATTLEHLIEIHIATYFINNDDDYKFFCSLFYPIDVGITFGIKIRLFEKFLEKTDPEYIKQNSDFIKSLNRVRVLRNNFAHSMNVKREELEKIGGKSYFELHYIEDGIRKTKQFPLKDIYERFDDLKKLIAILENLFKILVKTKELKKSK